MSEDNGVPALALTRDNTHLSRPTLAQSGVLVSAIDGTHSPPDAVASYVCDSLAPGAWQGFRRTGCLLADEAGRETRYRRRLGQL
jgi:hypothetical protein